MEFAKGTWIILADGSRRRIEDIRVGDTIISNGKLSMVVNVWRGYEEKLVKIEVEDGTVIRLTPDSGLMTSQGVKQANRINCGDLLQCIYGSVSAVRSVETVEYQDIVYQLCFDHYDSVYYANGFVVSSIQPE